jgi:L-ascorbate metabolism protein UlaG (beta-lactamase superfamily)
MNEPLYLKDSVRIEPLFNRWHAWVLMLPPVTAALNLLERCMKIMQSYVNSPALHVAAVQNPAMRGGPFINLDGGRVEDVRRLIAETQDRNQKVLELARAIKDLNRLLAEKAKGEAMQPLYAEVPDLLRGLVELCYDLNHNPSFRVFESLLYRSQFYCEIESAQSFELADEATEPPRPFVLSTPRLRSRNAVTVNLPFSSRAMDPVFEMRNTPASYRAMRDRLGVDIENEPLFKSFFANEAPAPRDRFDGDSFRIRYFGHACLLIESKDVSILIDPLIGCAPNGKVPAYGFSDLPDEIDYLLITHSHHDHVVIESLLQLRPRVKTAVVGRNYDGLLHDPSLQLMLERLGFRNVIEIRDMQEIAIPGGAIIGTPFIGEHHDLLMQSRTGYLVRIGECSAMVIADSCSVEPRFHEHLFDGIGGADILFLGMECDGARPSWIYGPLFPKPLAREIDSSRRARGCNFEEARALVDTFRFKQVYVYAMGQEPWVTHILDNEFTEDSRSVVESRKLVDYCRSRGIIAENLFGKKEIRP